MSQIFEAIDKFYKTLQSKQSSEVHGDLMNTAGQMDNVLAIDALCRLLAMVYTEKECARAHLASVDRSETDRSINC
jgi:hypothetical protein